MMDNFKYRPGVGMMLINAERKVFVGKRKDDIRFHFKTASGGSAWQMPQGGIDADETPEEAALRELKEETGTDLVKLITVSQDWHQYELPTEVIYDLWNGKYIGQRQKWFLFKFLGKDEDININYLSPEFTAWRWVDIDELPDLIVSFKKPLYQAIINEFKPFIEQI